MPANKRKKADVDSEPSGHEQAELLRAIVETAVDAIVSIDSRGTIRTFNPSASRMFGYSPEEAIGQNVSILMPSPYREDHDGYIARYRRTHEARIIGIGREVVAQRKDDTTFPVVLAVSEIDHLGLFVGMIRDISQQKELQRKIVEAAEEEQRRIAQELHDGVQQDLLGLGMLAQVLSDSLGERKAPESDQAQRIAVGIADANRNIRLLAKNLLPVEVDAQGLALALEQAASRCRELHGKDCQFIGDERVEIGKNLIATQLHAIAHEAMTNAVKHAKCSQIRIRLLRDAEGIKLEVRDNGIGFEPDGKHNGAGLSIMAYRANLIGGSLAVRTISSGGTAVSCFLPSIVMTQLLASTAQQ